jgi:pSer/pThr/pTyr-binding forkhead associated (FHA) protein
MMEVHICNGAGTMLRAFAIGDNAEVIVGRDDSCDIRIVSKSVSREHCSIEESDDGSLVLKDLGSTAGTFVNGSRIDSVRLEDGIIVRIGPALLKFFDAGI